MTLSESLIRFIEENLVQDASSTPVRVDESLIQRGLVDSIGLLQIMTFVEQETGVRVPDDEVLPENFETVTRIVELVKRLQKQR